MSFSVRLREMCTDKRLLWPALGASAAVLLCVGAASSVLQASAAENPASLAAMISTLANPGTERNPLRPSNTRDPLRDEGIGISIPRMSEDEARRAGGTLEGLPEQDVIYTVRTVVDRDGRVSNFEVLLSNGEVANSHDKAVLDVIRQTRFKPAQTPLGQAVAVDVVWMIAKTTAVVLPTMSVGVSVAPQPKEPIKPAAQDPAPPVPLPGVSSAPRRFSRVTRSATA